MSEPQKRKAKKLEPHVWVVEFEEPERRGKPDAWWPFALNAVFTDKDMAEAVCAVYLKRYEQYRIKPWRVRRYVRAAR